MSARYKLIVQMDIAPEQEALFNAVYDEEHIPLLLQVRGVVSVQRLRRENTATIALGGTQSDFSFPQEPRFSAVYELDDADVAKGAAWAKAVDAGRWSTKVRPFTSNRRHTLHRIL